MKLNKRKVRKKRKKKGPLIIVNAAPNILIE